MSNAFDRIFQSARFALADRGLRRDALLWMSAEHQKGGLMARFVHEEAGETSYPRLEAKHGEELSIETVAAWASVQQTFVLREIADRIEGLEDAIDRLGRALSEK